MTNDDDKEDYFIKSVGDIETDIDFKKLLEIPNRGTCMLDHFAEFLMHKGYCLSGKDKGKNLKYKSVDQYFS